jgi:electron transport complex protein RnfC
MKTQDFLRCAPSKVIQRIREAGIVGMGGAGFPTHAKIFNAQGAQTLIVNKRVKSFLLIILNCDDGFFCTTPMHQNFHATNDFTGIVLHYTSGAEKILIKTLLDIEIPSGEFASDYGVLAFIFVC